ncbi:hypothetical protein BC834DRAFT_895700 [Gloeopeniophorella convolvens]|nr:hypothetical protein BC834DRAFT_895700 [Gloeopeniophorella convolvens]
MQQGPCAVRARVSVRRCVCIVLVPPNTAPGELTELCVPRAVHTLVTSRRPAQRTTTSNESLKSDRSGKQFRGTTTCVSREVGLLTIDAWTVTLCGGQWHPRTGNANACCRGLVGTARDTSARLLQPSPTGCWRSLPRPGPQERPHERPEVLAIESATGNTAPWCPTRPQVSASDPMLSYFV